MNHECILIKVVFLALKSFSFQGYIKLNIIDSYHDIQVIGIYNQGIISI